MHVSKFSTFGAAAAVLLLAGLLLAVLPACAFGRRTDNEPIDAEAFHSLVPGRSTAADAVALLGAPSDVVQLGRRSAYRWDATVTKSTVTVLLVLNMANQDSRSDRVWLFFDEADRLTHKGGTFATHHPQYAAVWEDVHEAADSRARDRHRPGLDPTVRPQIPDRSDER